MSAQIPSIAVCILGLCHAFLATQAATAAPALVADPTQTTTSTSTPASGGSTPYNLEHRPEFGGAYSGVAKLAFGGTGCSGALMSDGMHLLTAAHCVAPNGVFSFSSGTAQFAITPGANVYTGSLSSVAIASVLVHPGWTGNFITGGNDLAIVTLASAAPAGAARYDLYSGTGDVGAVALKSGWGLTGTGLTGSTGALEWRVGQNRWDTTLDLIEINGSNKVLVYDYDDGTALHDLMFRFGFTNLGLGSLEIMAAPGDSGGPSFIGGQIAGIASFRYSYGTGFGDINSVADSTFGEMGGDTRVASFNNWILSSVPEPASGWLYLAGLLTLGFVARRKRSASALDRSATDLR